MTMWWRWSLCLLSCVSIANSNWETVKPLSSNYDAHPSRGTVIFVKAILTPDCNKFQFSTRKGKNKPALSPSVKYEVVNERKAKVSMSFDYNSDVIKFKPRGELPSQWNDYVAVDVAIMPHGFSFTLSYAKSKVFLNFNGRMLFADAKSVNLLDDALHKYDLVNSKAFIEVVGCKASEQRVIIRKTTYVPPFRFTTHWLSNQRALGNMNKGNRVVCNLRCFKSPGASFELGVYGRKSLGSGLLKYSPSSDATLSFMGLALNKLYAKDVNVLHMTMQGEYNEKKDVLVKDFGYDSGLSDDGYELSLSMEMDSAGHYMYYRVTGSVSREIREGPPKTGLSKYSAVHLRVAKPSDFYYTALRYGSARRFDEARIVNRTWSSCAMHGPSDYRVILDRSQRLTLTYSFWEDHQLMTRVHNGQALSQIEINGEYLIPREEYRPPVDDDWP